MPVRARLRSLDRATVLPVVLALVVLLPGIGWGLPAARDKDTTDPWGYDEQAPLPPLIEVRAKFARPPGGYLVYPLFHYIVLTAGYAPYLGYEYAVGHFRPAAGYPYGMDSPVRICRNLTLIARGITVLMAVGCVLAAAALARAAGATRWVAAGVGCGVALLPVFAYYGRTANMDVPYVFWTLLAFKAAADIAVSGRHTTGPFVRVGVFAALAVCTKDQAYAFLIPLPPLLLAALYARTPRDLGRLGRLGRARSHRPLWLGFTASLVAFALGNNLITGFDGFREHVRKTLDQAGTYREYQDGTAGQLALLADAAGQLAWALGPAAILAAVGLVRLGANRQYAVLWLLLAPIVSHHVLVIAGIGYVYPRFMLVPAVLLVVAAGGAFLPSPGGFRRTTLAALAVVSFGYLVFAAVDLTRAQLADARYDAAAYLAAHAVPGQKIESYSRFANLLPDVPPGVAVELVPADGLSVEKLRQRNRDFIIVTNLNELGVLSRPENAGYVSDLTLGRLGYSVVFSEETPAVLARRFAPGIAPRVIILARDPDSGSR